MSTENTKDLPFLNFDDISFSYPPVESDNLGKNDDKITPKPVFDYFSATLPSSFVHLVGPNACGKSTLLLLAAGRLSPQRGLITLFGQNPANLNQTEKNYLASFLYQNMELETTDCVQSLLEQVQESGSSFHQKQKVCINDLISIFKLKNILDRNLISLSKGELQKVLITFSILYNSKSIFMDEPLFALENIDKETILDFLRNYSSTNRIPIYISMHDIDLTKKYAENVLLMYPNRDMEFGTPDEILISDSLEKAYGVPSSMLRNSEELNRKSMKEAAEVNQSVLKKLFN